MPWTPRLFTVYKMFFFCTIYKVVYHFQLESKWKLTFGVVPAENFWEQWNFCKGSPVFLDRIFQMAIHVPFLASKPSLMTVSDLHGCFSRNRTDLGCCVICAPLAKYWLTLSADTQSTCRPICLPTLGCHIKRHISRILVDLSANMSTNRLADGVGQYVDRQSGDISIDTPPTFRRYFTAT